MENVVRLVRDDEEVLVDPETQRELYDRLLQEGWQPEGAADVQAPAEGGKGKSRGRKSAEK